MTPPKKSADLSALKARLAKKNAPAGGGMDIPPPGGAPPPAFGGIPAPGEAIPAPGEAIPAPGEAIPAPGEAFIPAPGEAIPAPGEAFIPAPGEALPAPGQALPPPGQPAAAPPPDPTRDGAFAGTASAFNPNDGIIDVGGDVPAKTNTGLIAFAAAGALAVGVLFGWIGKGTLDKSQRIDRAKAKGQKMLAEVQNVADMRKDISLKLEDIKKQIGTDPKAGGEALTQLNATNFEKHPKVDDLFGWQLASIHPKDIRKTFQLYEEANGLKTDLSYLAGFVTANAASLGAKGGPSSFGVLTKEKGGVTLVEVVTPLCGGGEEGPKPCAGDDAKNASAFLVRTKLGEEPKAAPAGQGPGQVTALSRTDEMYLYLVGQNPENNAKFVYGRLLGKVTARLEEMNKVERRSLNALKAYSDNPDVDGSNPQGEAGDE